MDRCVFLHRTERESPAGGGFALELHGKWFLFGNLSRELGGFLGAFKSLPSQFGIAGMIARAVSAGSHCVGVRCMVVEFRGLGMFALGHGSLLFRQAYGPPVPRVFHLSAESTVQSGTGAAKRDSSVGKGIGLSRAEKSSESKMGQYLQLVAPKTVLFLYTGGAMSCIFCKIIDGSIPSTAVYQDEQCYAFADLHPQAPVHILVTPREHIASLADGIEGDRALLGHLLWAAAQIAHSKGLGKGYRVVINTGEDGGQTVDHLHVHLLGGRAMNWPPG